MIFENICISKMVLINSKNFDDINSKIDKTATKNYNLAE